MMEGEKRKYIVIYTDPNGIESDPFLSISRNAKRHIRERGMNPGCVCTIWKPSEFRKRNFGGQPVCKCKWTGLFFEYETY